MIEKIEKVMNREYPSKINFEVAIEEHKFHNLFYVSIFMDAFIFGLKKEYGRGLKNNFFDLKGDYLRYVVDADDYDRVAKRYFNLVKSKPEFVEKINCELLESISEVFAFSGEMLKTDFSKKTNAKLLNYVSKYSLLLKKMIALGMFPVVMEIRTPLYTNFLTQLIYKKRDASVSTTEAVATLCSFDGETKTKSEQIELLKLALKVKTIENLKNFEEQLQEHADKYSWLGYGYGGPVLSENEYREALSTLLKDGHMEEKLKKFEESKIIIEQKRKFFEEKLQLNEKEKKYFAIAREFMKGKALRKEAMSFAAYASEPLQLEIGKKLKISLTQVRCMLFDELKNALEKNEIDVSEINKRIKTVVYGVFKEGEEKVIVTGKEAEKYAALIKEEKIVGMITELKGQCACAGKATGIVKIVQRPEEMHKMKRGDILVSHATTTDLLLAMRLASAIVTDTGGLTSHAAIVSRELGVPCIIGTRLATKVFKDGDLVEVDTKNGTVKKIKNAD